MLSDDTNSSCSSQSQGDSPYSSPAQHVPQLVNGLTGLSCGDQVFNNVGGPFLRIVEQPMHNFRFRYKSEMAGTHGCLLGKSSNIGNNKSKTHPTVELVNYHGKAMIRCRLVQHNCDDEHPHQLLDDREEDHDVCAVVPQNRSYKIGFGGIGIIHTAKRDVKKLIFKNLTQNQKSVNSKMLRSESETIAKKINLNIVRLRFSAHDIATDMEICKPVYSDPIHNLKSADTNDLKICRMSKNCGKVTGDEEVFIFVEKVGKKNLVIRFYETNDSGAEVWGDSAYFLPNDVHHQYGIVFKTPRYINTEITSDVEVQIVLQRPSDGRKSEPVNFTYKPDPQAKRNHKKRKVTSSFSSLGSSGNSLSSLSDNLPATVAELNLFDVKKEEKNTIFSIPTQPQIPQAPAQTGDILAEALQCSLGSDINPLSSLDCPMLSAPNVPAPPVLHINSSELDNLSRNPMKFTNEEQNQFMNSDWSEYLKAMPVDVEGPINFSNLFPDSHSAKKVSYNSMEFIRSLMVADSGKGNTCKGETKMEQHTNNSENNEYTPVYSPKDGAEVKKLLSELCEMMRTKTGRKQTAINKLKRLFELRLSNGDTFLHMSLCEKAPSFNYVVNIINSLRTTSLLQLGNYEQQTILHLAIANNMTDKIPFLISKGCDPMAQDCDGNNGFHYAVNYRSCLEELLTAVRANNVPYDLNVTNSENQTALHLAEKYRLVDYAKLLLQSGASYKIQDGEGRNPLHVAAYNDNVDIIRVLLDFIRPGDIDEPDSQGYTALQIVCGGPQRTNTLKIFTMLMDKEAHPMKQHGDNKSAWKLVVNKPELFEVMKMYVPSLQNMCSDDIKSEPDDYESADEGDMPETGLVEFSMFIDEVSGILDASGAWKELANKLELKSMIDWCGNNPSPTRTLLSVIKECRSEITSKSIALVLDEMGRKDVSSIIKKYLPK